MLKIAHLAPVVLALWVAPALAAPPGCLQQIDNMTVEFDLPAAESVATTESSSAYYIPPPPSSQITVPPPPTMTPAGRPGAPHVTSGSDTMGAPPLSPHNRLSKAQSAKLQSLLRQARGLEALGNEQQCFEVLAQAQELAKAQPAPAPAPARAKTRTPRPSKPS